MHIRFEQICYKDISSILVCGPGKYYGQIAPTNVYCRAFYKKTRACVPCPDNKVKLVSGNSKSLCIDAAQACDGTITVVNSDRSECSKLRHFTGWCFFLFVL